MNVREWALVAFTLLMQASVGILLVVTAVHSFAGRNSMHVSARAIDVPVLVTAAAAVLALVASLAHLGNPQQAWLAVANARTSWLSREIVLGAVYAACTVAVAVMSTTRSTSAPTQHACGTVAMLVGLATIYAMSRLYMVPAQPVWNRLLTPANFFASTIVLGAAAVVVMAASTSGAAGETLRIPPDAARMAMVVAIAALAAQLLLVPAQIRAIPGEPAAAISAASIGYTAVWLAAVRAVAALAAIVLLARALAGGPSPTGLAIPGTALVLVVLSEIFARVLFYASSTSLGPV